MKISVITVNYNDQLGLERTIKSLQVQTAMNYEHIIIDGGSTDGSAALIEQYQDRFSYWVSEPDNGIYHAMNKGIEVAQGDYILFMNSGDTFYSEHSTALFNKNVGTEDFVYFDIQLVKKNESIIFETHEKLTFSMLRERMPFHQATFIKRELFTKYGSYDEHLKIVADWKFFILAIAKYNASYKYVNEVMSTHYHDGISADPVNAPVIKKERESVLQEHFNFFIEEYKEIDALRSKLNLLRHSRKINWLLKLGWINHF
jgi:glycosyltransferase involved in cell wall biosynthesis